jgi:hypothetical protein
MSNIDRELKTRCAVVIANSKTLSESLLELDIRNDRVVQKAVDAIEHSVAGLAASFELADKIAIFGKLRPSLGEER